MTPEIQKQRLIARNRLSEQEAINRINSQLPMVEKEAGANAVIDNNGSIEETREQVESILEKWELKV